MSRTTIDILGIPVDKLRRDTLVERIQALLDSGRPATVSYANVHVCNTAQRDPALARFLAGVDLCYADGQGVVLASRLLGEPLSERMTGADWIEDVAAASAEFGLRIGWVGAEPGVAHEACRVLNTRFPGAQFGPAWHGFHTDWSTVLAEINQAQLDVLLVGMGTPIQEHWVARYRDRLDVPVVWCLGATADFVAGRTSRGPRFLYERHEWLARLLVEPRRLARRYLVGNPAFLARVLAQRLRDG